MEKMRQWSLLAALVCWGVWGLMVKQCSQNGEGDGRVHGPRIQTANVEKWQM